MARQFLLNLLFTMSNPQDLTQCINWVVDLIRQHSSSAADTPIEFASTQEAWIRLPFAPRSIGIRAEPDSQCITVMACGVAMATHGPAEGAPSLLPDEDPVEQQLQPIIFDGQFYGAWIPRDGTALISVQLRDNETQISDCPAALRQWFDAAVSLLK